MCALVPNYVLEVSLLSFVLQLFTTCNDKYHMKDAKVITAIMNSSFRFDIEFAEQILNKHEEEKMRMIQETCQMIEDHKVYLDNKRSEWEIEIKHLKNKSEN